MSGFSKNTPTSYFFKENNLFDPNYQVLFYQEERSFIRYQTTLSGLSSVSSWRNVLKLHQGRLWLDFREYFFTEGVDEHWNRLPRTVVELPSLEVPKKWVDMTIYETIYLPWWANVPMCGCQRSNLVFLDFFSLILMILWFYIFPIWTPERLLTVWQRTQPCTSHWLPTHYSPWNVWEGEDEGKSWRDLSRLSQSPPQQEIVRRKQCWGGRWRSAWIRNQLKEVENKEQK